MDKLEWQCPFCTLINKASSFKCRMCGNPKGTSTRQSKHTAAFEQQHLAETFHRNSGSSSGKRRGRLLKGVKNENRKRTTYRQWPTLDNIDRSSGRSYTVTVDSVTVIITEYNIIYPN